MRHIGRLSAALLVTAIAAAGSVSMTWVRANGSGIPTTADIDQTAVTAAGVGRELTATGAGTGTGALLLVLASGLAAVACWAVSPRYRPVRAAGITIVVALTAVAATLRLMLDTTQQIRAFGAAVDVDTAGVELTVWPSITLALFALAGVLAIGLVPSGSADHRQKTNRSQPNLASHDPTPDSPKIQ